MCLSTVYKENSKENKLLCSNIAKVENLDNSIVFTDILGRKTVVNGVIGSMDLLENIIIVREEQNL